LKKVIIYSDGACEGNPGPGGWAAVLRYGERQREISGYALATTNNRMEMQAAIEALRVLKEPCQVTFFTDSEYLRDGITAWVAAWKKKGWKTKERKPVKNCDLWRQLDELAAQHKISWEWVKGHAGNTWNERCDLLANQQIRSIYRHHKHEELTAALAQFREQHAQSSLPQVNLSEKSSPGPSQATLEFDFE